MEKYGLYIGFKNTNPLGHEYEVTDIYTSTRINVLFKDSGYRCIARADAVRQGKVKDKLAKKTYNGAIEGGVYTNNLGLEFMVIKIHSTKKVDVEFIKTKYTTICSVNSIKNKSVKDLYDPSVFGVGFIGEKNASRDYNYIYKMWCNMLYRCYDEKFKVNQPTYKDAIVCNEWHDFRNFREWVLTQDYKDKELDKDILTYDCKIYSPETCVFISKKINQLLVFAYNSKGKMKTGVTKHQGKYLSQASYGYGKGERKYLGVYDTENEAHEAYIRFKSGYIKELAENEPDRIKNGLIVHADRLMNSIS